VVRDPNATGEGPKGARPPRVNGDGGTTTQRGLSRVGKRKQKCIMNEEDEEDTFEQQNKIKQ